MKGWRLSDIRIRSKLFALVLVLVLVPFLVESTLILGQVSRELEGLGFHTADQVMAQSASYLESRFDLAKRALDLLTLNPTLRDLSAADPRPYDTDASLWIRDAAVLHQMEDTVSQNNPDLRGFVLYTRGGLGASAAQEESSEFRSLTAQAGEAWFQALDPAENLPQWFPASEAFGGDPTDLRVFRRIPDDQDLLSTVGWARADLRIRGFQDILDKAQFSEASAAFVVDGAGRAVLGSSRARDLGTADGAAGVLGALVPAEAGVWVPRTAGGRDYWVRQTPLKSTGWSLVLAIPAADLGAFGDRTRTLLLLMLLVLGPLLVPLSLWAASSSTRRLDLLLKGVRRLGDGQTDVVLPPSGRDEIGELTASFNGMVSRIRTLLDHQYRLGLEVKHRELEILQAQINPHFLYNTLDLISGQAHLAGQPQIANTVSALSKFYRLSLAGGAEEIELSREFDHAASYVAIQNLRFEGAVTLETYLAPSLGRVLVMKMILQPLVENALLHGILEKDSGRGTIRLSARTEGDDLVLTVEDDGVGMDPDQAEALVRRPRDSLSGSGYGINNIERRLKLRYGDRAGLRFSSRPGQGTRAEIRLTPGTLSQAPLINPVRNG